MLPMFVIILLIVDFSLARPTLNLTDRIRYNYTSHVLGIRNIGHNLMQSHARYLSRL